MNQAFENIAISAQSNTSVTLLKLVDHFNIAFAVDELGAFFASVMGIVWLVAGIFAFKYKKNEKNGANFLNGCLMTLVVLMGLCFAANFITFYMFYVFTILCSLPLVLHSQTEEAFRAGKKYLFCSMLGAFCSLAGIFCLNLYSPGLNFVKGGCLDYSFAGGDRTFLLIAALLIIAGFGMRAGMLPMHGWLTKVHWTASGQTDAVFACVLAYTGVLGILRTVYDVFGADYIRGTFVQYVWIALVCISVLVSLIVVGYTLYKSWYLHKNSRDNRLH